MKYFQILLLLGINFSKILLSQSIEIPHKMMNQNTTLNIPIFIYNVSELESIQLIIEYDASIILAEEIIENPVGILDGGYTFTPNLTEPGIIQLAIGSNSANVFSGSGMIAQITFESIGELGEFSSLTLSYAEINSNWQVPRVHGSIEIVLDELIISGQDNSEMGADHSITLGMCEGCTDEWKFGEDEYDYPNPSSGEYTNINLYHTEWFGEIDENGNSCNQVEFASDFRSQHSFRELTSWGISGSVGGGLSSDIDINLSWNSMVLYSSSDNFQSFIFVGDEGGVDMQQQSNITISQSDLYLNENGEPNIWIKLGVCADIGGTTISYLDYDGDGLGSDITAQYCSDYEPAGWVTNSNDEDDYCYSNEHDCENVCDGIMEFDCLGECGGTSILDECDICNGDNSFCTDCNGDTYGSAYVDGCGECVGGNTGNDDCPYDCLGIPDGAATTDNCGNCDNDSSNDCVQDCAGEWGGNLVLDACGICGGPGSTSNCGCTDIPASDCDCDGNQLDDCLVCGGDSSSCTDCNEDINGEAFIDDCGECVGGNTGNDSCQYDCFGVAGGTSILDACGICGGSGIPEGDCDCEGNQFDACGICGGSGIPEGDCTCEGNILDDCEDCVGVDVNYINENMDIFGTCCSLDEKDICGECEGIGIIDGECDCAGNVLDCAAVCGGSTIKDNCGICNGDNSTCTDCNGYLGGPNGIPFDGDEAYLDGCEDCVGGNTGIDACLIDCNGDPDGLATKDNCGECDDSPNNDCTQDCAGIWGGNAIIDDCGICVGGSTGVEPCAMDCAEVLGGTFWVSDCGCVEADNSGDECDDCAGIPNGSADIDLCGNCLEDSSDLSYECEPDCDGIYGGNHPPTFTCQNGTIACNYNMCNSLTNNDLLLPLRFDINRIYPNPFNPQATIDYEVSEPTMVHLNIYNLKGQAVEVLINKFTLPGYYSVIWNGNNHPSGIYFVILQSSNSIVKQKMMLIK